MKIHPKSKIISVPTVDTPLLKYRQWLARHGIHHQPTKTSWLLVTGDALSSRSIEARPLLPEAISTDPDTEALDRTYIRFTMTETKFVLDQIEVATRVRRRGIASAMTNRIAEVWAGDRLLEHSGGWVPGGPGEQFASAHVRSHPQWHMPRA